MPYNTFILKFIVVFVIASIYHKIYYKKDMNKTYLFAIVGILVTGLLTAGISISSSSVVAQNMTDVGNETGAMDATSNTTS